MPASPGKETTEHARASRAEAAAFALLACGLVFALLGSLHGEWTGAAVGVLFVAVGAGLLASVNRSYSESRGSVKAAAARPRTTDLPKDI